ncbi:DUF1450 domain-containing protein [Bacillus thermotolerans]|uniref:DUF1450 domain-containing protein n=1 Tax=Bacillus thermotolerans TaxID=1221996 RepID=A0A0F5I8D0_BACTR|nr:DUF1450 domain-containing protein [Bacillus thermotolerans]KKB41781.1 hypothetical protein QY95_00588 [Bacillus thermotolerans]KKB44326.1 hypothetical protein QY96_02926 [Bacillus thermotolerans]
MSLLTKLLSKNKKIKVEFCEKNLDRFLTEEQSPAYETFLNQRYVSYKEYQCQSRCEECKKSPYAIVNGDFVQTEDDAELLGILKAAAKK